MTFVPIESVPSGARVSVLCPEPVHGPPVMVVYGPVKGAVVWPGVYMTLVPTVPDPLGGKVKVDSPEPVQGPPFTVV
jgi:hypothetical protein